MNKSVDKAIRILQLISENNQGLTLSEIARICKYPKTSVYDILCSLEKHKMIYKRDDRMTYSIGFLAYSIGCSYSRTSHLLQNSIHLCEMLSEKIGKSVLLGKLQNSKVFYVQKCSRGKGLINTPDVGDFVDFGHSALGAVFSAYLPDDLSVKTSHEQIEKCKADGYAILEIKGYSSLYSLAAPIFNFENILSGGIEIQGLYNDRKALENDIKELCSTAHEISANMGYAGSMQE